MNRNDAIKQLLQKKSDSSDKAKIPQPNIVDIELKNRELAKLQFQQKIAEAEQKKAEAQLRIAQIQHGQINKEDDKKSSNTFAQLEESPKNKKKSSDSEKLEVEIKRREEAAKAKAEAEQKKKEEAARAKADAELKKANEERIKAEELKKKSEAEKILLEKERMEAETQRHRLEQEKLKAVNERLRIEASREKERAESARMDFLRQRNENELLNAIQLKTLVETSKTDAPKVPKNILEIPCVFNDKRLKNEEAEPILNTFLLHWPILRKMMTNKFNLGDKENLAFSKSFQNYIFAHYLTNFEKVSDNTCAMILFALNGKNYHLKPHQLSEEEHKSCKTSVKQESEYIERIIDYVLNNYILWETSFKPKKHGNLKTTVFNKDSQKKELIEIPYNNKDSIKAFVLKHFK